VTRYDGQSFATLTAADGLGANTVATIFEDREGYLWLGTEGGGVSRYDGEMFQTLTRQDGLAGNTVRAIHQDEDGTFWFGTSNGMTRYRPPPPVAPAVFIDSVVAGRRYEATEEVVAPLSTGLIVFEFHALSYKTRRDAVVYRYRLRGHEESWQTARRRRVEYQDLPLGAYVFEVVAVDRDMVRSEEPARVSLRIVPDPKDQQIDELEQRVRERTRELEETHQQLAESQERLIEELDKELRIAHDLQMSLMPTASPRLQGTEVAGQCISANHVGGDFYQYYERPAGLSICLADVTGHAMEAAIPVVMFSGLLDKQMEYSLELEERFDSLNRSLCRSLDDHTFVCLTMVDVDSTGEAIRLASCGCPYPLGVRADNAYTATEITLHEGDYLVLHSDGFSEAANARDEIFGFERTIEVVRSGCRQEVAPEELIARLTDEVTTFAGDAPQADDMTCVVVGRRVR